MHYLRKQGHYPLCQVCVLPWCCACSKSLLCLTGSIAMHIVLSRYYKKSCFMVRLPVLQGLFREAFS